MAAHAGLGGEPVALDEHGMTIDGLAATRVRSVLLTPAHQSPTGVVLAPDRRRALIEWAVERDATILEDDYDAEFRYDREPVGAMQGLAPDRVAYLGTVSKSLAPALRLGWIVCPPLLAEAVAEQKQSDDRGSPVLEQLVLARLIESGRFDKHPRRMRAVYAARRRALVDALTRHAPAVALSGLAAGFHAVARPPHAIDERAVVSAAAERSIQLHPMSWYAPTGQRNHPSSCSASATSSKATSSAESRRSQTCCADRGVPARRRGEGLGSSDVQLRAVGDIRAAVRAHG
jgi:GntR family transcriptional regulator/MocR family aminotransferase